MKTTSIRDLLAEQPVLRDLEPADIDLMAGCSHNEVFAAGTSLAREREVANRFFVVREGHVALELQAPTGPLLIETIGAGDLVGWSWLFPPYRWAYDVEAIERTRVIVIESACLRDKCDADPAFGYRVMKRFAHVVIDRLHTTQYRLLDLYGAGDVR
jgi:CRP/FNR family transcriptional regulator, cyclic AMP receptor protein